MEACSKGYLGGVGANEDILLRIKLPPHPDSPRASALRTSKKRMQRKRHLLGFYAKKQKYSTRGPKTSRRGAVNAAWLEGLVFDTVSSNSESKFIIYSTNGSTTTFGVVSVEVG